VRDLFLLAALPALLYAMSKRPFVGLGMWVWTAMFYPNAWVYGIASAPRYNLIFAGITILGYLVDRTRPKPVMTGHAWLILSFLLWTTLSSLLTEGNPPVVWEMWSRFAKGIVLFVFVLLIMERKIHVDFFLWCLVTSVGFFAGVEGLKWVASGGGHNIAGLHGHILADRNELAVAFVMTIPICMYLLRDVQQQPYPHVARWLLLGCMAACVVAVVGTDSRGGFISLSMVGTYLFIKSDRKLPLLVLGGILIALLANFVPDDWVARMNTINHAEEDASFMGRVVAWKLNFIMAVQHPFFGGGFKSVEYFPVWAKLSQHFDSFAFFYSGDAVPPDDKARAAHSIYFQVLGEHGFVGLALFLTIMIGGYRLAGQVSKKARKVGAPDWIAQLSSMLQLCMFCYLVGGAALSFAYYEVTYALIGVLIVLRERFLAPYVKAAKAAAPTGMAPRIPPKAARAPGPGVSGQGVPG
jgi:probable O-glycosylation ligase (exosortase A-associated)